MPNTQMSLSPGHVLFGQEMLLPIDTLIASPNAVPLNNANFAFFQTNLNLLRTIARENSEDARLKAKEYFDRKAKTVSFSVGDVVLLLDHTRPLGSAGRYQPLFCGPYQILDKKKNAYKLKCLQTERVRKQYSPASHLKKCIFPEDELGSVFEPMTLRSRSTRVGTHKPTDHSNPIQRTHEKLIKNKQATQNQPGKINDSNALTPVIDQIIGIKMANYQKMYHVIYKNQTQPVWVTGKYLTENNIILPPEKLKQILRTHTWMNQRRLRPLAN